MVNSVAFRFEKVCENCHIVSVINFLTCSVHCNACHLKSSFFYGSVATNDEPMLLTIEGKWLEAIVHMMESEFLDLLHAKQVQLFISIHIHGKFQLSPTFALVGF